MYTYVLEVKQIFIVEADSDLEAESKVFAGKYTTSSIGDVRHLAKLKKLDKKEND